MVVVVGAAVVVVVVGATVVVVSVGASVVVVVDEVVVVVAAGVVSVLDAVSDPLPFEPTTVMVYSVDGDGAVNVASGPVPSTTMPSALIDHIHVLIVWFEDADAVMVLPLMFVVRLTTGAGSEGVVWVVKATSEPFAFLPVTVIV